MSTTNGNIPGGADEKEEIVEGVQVPTTTKTLESGKTGVNLIVSWARNAFGRGAKGEKDAPEADAVSRRDFLFGRRGKGDVSPEANIDGLNFDVMRLAATVGILFALKSVNGEVFIDKDKTRVVDVKKRDEYIKTCGGGEGFFNFLFEHFWATTGVVAGIWAGNKILRSPNVSEMRDAVVKKSQNIEHLAADLSKVGMFGSAPGQFDEAKLKNPNMNRKFLGKLFSELAEKPKKLLNMLPHCVQELEAILQSIPQANPQPNQPNANGIPQADYEKITQLVERYNFTDLPTWRAVVPNDVATLRPFIDEVRQMRDDPDSPATVDYLTKRITAIGSIFQDEKMLLFVDEIRENNLDISKEVPFWEAFADVVQGNGRVNRRQFFWHIIIPMIAGGALGVKFDGPSTSSEKEETLSPEEKAAQKKEAEEGLRKIRERNGVGNGPKSIDEALDGSEAPTGGQNNNGSGERRDAQNNGDDNSGSQPIYADEEEELIKNLSKKK